MENAYAPIFTKQDKRSRVILIPNLSRGFGLLMTSVLYQAGYKCQSLPLADEEAKKLGKMYVHNDICYPAQINIGECLKYIRKHKESAGNFAVAIAKNCQDCRAGQYAALARKALDDSGYTDMPIVTTGTDTKKMHPGFNLDILSAYRSLVAVRMLDALENVRLAIRPYESNKGDTDRVFDKNLDRIAQSIENWPHRSMHAFRIAVHELENISVTTDKKRPRVFIIGEILMNYHESANMNIVRYLENNGMEVVLPGIITFFERQIIQVKASIKKKLLRHPVFEYFVATCKDWAFKKVNAKINRCMKKSRFYTPSPYIESLAANIDGHIDRTHSSGEGWLILAEIIENAKRGIQSFVIVQPFGCLPNQVTGKAIVSTAKKLFPKIQIVSIDYDADVSEANIENRLQMLIMAAKAANDQDIKETPIAAQN